MNREKKFRETGTFLFHFIGNNGMIMVINSGGYFYEIYEWLLAYA